MALSRALTVLWLGSALALRRPNPVEEKLGDTTFPRERTGQRRTMGNFTDVDDMTVHNVLPVLQGCKGFECIEKYVGFDDGAFSWGYYDDTERGSTNGVSWVRHLVRLSTQAWMARETGKEAWTHSLLVTVPDTYSPEGSSADACVIFIEQPVDPWAATEMATRTGLITALVTDVPNADLSFPSDRKYGAEEEDLKAWSWTKFVQDAGHPEWPVEMPDVKAVVRAMDAVAAFTGSAEAQVKLKLKQAQRFIVTGHSKRAIAAYMAGAVDPRVKAIIPVGISLNMYETGLESAHNLGGIPPEAIPYVRQGAMDLTEEQYKKLRAIIDPINYVDRLKMPKLAIFSGADDFLPPDVTRSWWGSVPEPKMMYVYGNSGHRGFDRLANVHTKFLDVAEAFVSGFVSGSKMPKIEWAIGADNGDITVRQVSDHTPTSVTVVATKTKTTERRDFRKAHWTSRGRPTEVGHRTWLAAPPESAKWCGFFLAFEYPGPRAGGPPWRLTTEVSVTPDTRPYQSADPLDREWHHVVFPPH